MNEFPVLVVGPRGAGKSSALQTLCGEAPLRRRMVLADGDKALAIGVDQSNLKIPGVGELALRIYPAKRSQLLASFVKQVPHAGALLLIDGSDDAAIEELRHYLKQLSTPQDAPAVAIGVTHVERMPRNGLDGLALQIADFGLRCPLFRVDENKRDDIALLLEALLLTIHMTMDDDTLDGFSSFTEPMSSDFCS